jgi:hypothetical protein
MLYRRIESTTLVVIASCVLLAFLVSGWMMFLDGTWPTPVVTYAQDVFPTTQYRYKPGDVVTARIKATKTRDLVGTVHWTMEDTSQPPVQFNPRPLSLGKGCWDVDRPIETIPKNTEPGVYRMRGIVTYPVNELRTINFSVKTSDFMVEKDSP